MVEFNMNQTFFQNIFSKLISLAQWDLKKSSGHGLTPCVHQTHPVSHLCAKKGAVGGGKPAESQNTWFLDIFTITILEGV